MSERTVFERVLRCTTDVYPVRRSELRELFLDPSWRMLSKWRDGMGRGYVGTVGTVHVFELEC